MISSAMEILRQLPGFKSAGTNQWEAKCPGHDDKRASLAISIGNDGRILLHCFASCGLDRILEAAGIQKKDLFSGNGNNLPRQAQRQIVATYDYTDAEGNLIYQVVRFEPKGFAQRRPDGNGGWIWDTKGVKRVPYNLPELAKAEYIFIVEGEKDVESLRQVGLTATCNAGGAGKWMPELSQYFRSDQHVTIIPDNDKPGRDHAREVAQSLQGKVATLKILELPGLPAKGDVSDWLAGRDAVGAAEELSRLADAAEEWQANQSDVTKKQAASDRFIIHWAREALDPQPDIPWILDRLICEGSVAAFVGDSGTKKTWILLALAVCVALGIPWCGITTSPRTVLIADEESGPRRLMRRLGDVMRGFGAEAGLPVAFTCFNLLDLRTPVDRIELTQKAREVGAGLIIVDALADIMLGGDENTVMDLQPVLVNLRRMAEETRAGVALIHHTNRQGKYRGSASLKAAVDLMLMVESQADSDRILFTCEKSRDSLIEPFSAISRFEPGLFRLDSVGTGGTITKLTPAQQYVLRYLRKERVATVKEIMAHADVCQPGTAKNALYSLVVLKMAYRSDLGGSGSEATYKLVRDDTESSNE